MANHTIHEVARLAGVSSATVSRVLNQSEKVLPETRQRVMDAVASLEYTPNSNSRSLRTRQSKILLVMLPSLSNPFYSDILAGMDACAHEYGYSMMVTATYSSASRERELVRLLRERQADGVIMLASTLPADEMRALGSQFAVVECCEYTEGSGISFVSVDNFAASREATAYLIRAGHRLIGMSSSTNNFPSTRLREEGFRRAHEEAGIVMNPALIRRGNYTFESGYENAQIFMGMQPRPTAVMAISDVVAAGLISAFSSAGLNVPGDISVMGFDNLDMAKMIQPTLSTVMQPRRRLGRTAVEMLLEQLRGGRERHQLMLPHELIIRHSTR